MNQCGYRKWLILLAFFVVSLFQFGGMKAFGVLMPRFVEQMNISETEAGLGCGIGMAFANLLGPIWGVFPLFASNRQVTIVGGILTGLGFILVSQSVNAIQLYITMAVVGIGHGLPMVAKVLILREYFEEDFNMANGLGFTGGAVGMVVLPPLTDFFITTYGMRGAILLLSALSFNICISGIAMKPRYPRGKRTDINLSFSEDEKEPLDTNDEEKSLINTHNGERLHEHTDGNSFSYCSTVRTVCGLSTIAKAPMFVIYLASFTLTDTAMSGWVIFLFYYSISIGFSTPLASNLATIAGIGAFIGRALCGPLLDKNILSAKSGIIILNVGACVSLLLYPYTTSYWGVALLSLVTGLCTGTNPPLNVALIKDIFPDNLQDFTCGVWLHYTARGFGLLVGAPLTGWIHTQTDNWSVPFFTLAGFEFFAAILVLITPSRLD